MATKQMSIQVKEGQLRAKPSFLGKILYSLPYGTRVVILSTSGIWSKVATVNNNATGWIHSSALTTKKIVIRASRQDAQVAASSDELALAGKGFNKQVEKEFKTKNKNIDFSWVDRMEQTTISPQEMQAFLKEGGLTPKEAN